MDIIHLLPDSVANQIAAGEVVQRPASVIKELMENAVDAGATSIDVLIVNAGCTSIQVIDDGKGMSEQDARMAFERHATSKIRQASDLFSLTTMGFRGEALPSIAAVAQVHLTTKTIDAELGTELTIEGSKIISQEMCSCPIGCNMEVRNLFFNIPARRRFLKKEQTEYKNVLHEFERIALVNPSISFTLTHNGTLVASYPASSLRQRIVNVAGKAVNGQLLSLDVDTSLVRITGFIGKPDAAVKKTNNQYFFVNGRYMRHPFFHKVVLDAFEHLIPEGSQIPYFLYFNVDPANIDVNIHPTKTEIKFENELGIRPVIIAAVRETLGKFNAVPTIDFDVEGRPDIPVFDSQHIGHAQAPRLQVNTDFNPFRANSAPKQHSSMNWEQLYAGLEKTAPLEHVEDTYSQEARQESLFAQDEQSEVERSTEHFQFKGQYILTPVQSGMMMVEQHRAHVRVLYDKYRRQLVSQGMSSQGVLFPEILQLPASDAALLEEMSDDLRRLGFDVSSLGGGSFSINGVPSELAGANPVTVLTQMVETAREKGTGMEGELHHRIALVMARNTSIVVGQVLSIAEMEALVNDLFQCENPNLTPTGQTIIAILKQEQMDKMFNI